MREKTAGEMAEKQRIQKKTDEDPRLECIESGNTAPRTNEHLTDTGDQTEEQYRLAAIETVEERNASPGITAQDEDAGIIESERRKERSSDQIQTEARLREEATGSRLIDEAEQRELDEITSELGSIRFQKA